MRLFFQMMSLSAVLVGSAIIGPAIAIFFLRRRKARVHSRRRSPLTEKLMRSPGGSLRLQLENVEEEVNETLIGLIFFPMAMVAVGAGAVALNRATLSMALVLYPTSALIAIAWCTRRLLRSLNRRDVLRRGYDAEVAVGQELDRLMRHGAYVFHDVPADGFNVDHVVVASTGVFAVETKGYTKPVREGRAEATVIFDGSALRFPSWTSTKPLAQTERQARWIHQQLVDMVDGPLDVVPVVALPGWYVRRTGRGNVRVYSGAELKHLLRNPGARPLNPNEIKRIALVLEQRCRTESPLFAPS